MYITRCNIMGLVKTSRAVVEFQARARPLRGPSALLDDEPPPGPHLSAATHGRPRPRAAQPRRLAPHRAGLRVGAAAHKAAATAARAASARAAAAEPG